MLEVNFVAVEEGLDSLSGETLSCDRLKGVLDLRQGSEVSVGVIGSRGG